MNEARQLKVDEEAAAQNAEATERGDTALYKYPGSLKIHGDKYDYKVVPACDVDAACKDGWARTTPAAKEAYLDSKIEKAKEPESKAPEPVAKRKPGRPFKVKPAE